MITNDDAGANLCRRRGDYSGRCVLVDVGEDEPKWWRPMTHKYRGCIVVFSISKSVEPNEEQNVLTSSFDEGFTINAHRQVFRRF
jgi:hypothetical protein